MNFFVKDYLKNSITDSEAIEKCLSDANKILGDKTIIFNGKNYLIDRAILISSNTNIIIDNCTIKQNDCVFDNVFRGDNLILNELDPNGTPIDVSHIENIKILGKGDAKIIGCDKNKIGYHPYFDRLEDMVGDFWGWRTITISLSNAKNVEISGLKISNTKCWCICFDYSKNVFVHDIDIRSNVKNGDGIDFRSGCCYCEVDNITGYTSDDTVALTALSKGKEKRQLSKYLYTLEPYNSSHENIDGSIHHVKISNVYTGGNHHGVICLTAFGNKVHDIEIRNIIESKEGDRDATVMLYTGYGDGYNKGDLSNIIIDGVVANTAKSAVKITCETENLTIKNVSQNNINGVLFTKN